MSKKPEILKIKFKKDALYNYILNHYDNSLHRNIVFTSLLSNSYYRKCVHFRRENYTSTGFYYNKNEPIKNFPGPKNFTIKLKEFNTKQEFIDNYVFEDDNIWAVMHFNLKTRKFLTKEI
jgi:hypothetical protein